MSKPYSQQKSASEYLKELYEKQSSQEKPISQSEQNQLESSKQSSSEH